MKKQKWTPLSGVMAVVCALALIFGPVVPLGQAQQSALSRAAGRFNASAYNYGAAGGPGAFITVGNTSTGTQTITVCMGGPGLALSDGRTIIPFAVNAPITVDAQNGSVTETVTPTSVSTFQGSASAGGSSACANITGSFTFAHGASLSPWQIKSGTFGLQEAINDAFSQGGGVAVIDGSWGGASAKQATMALLAPYANVVVEDLTAGAPQYWNPQGGATTLAAPAVLTAVTALPSATPVGAFTATNYNTCIAYVDIFGQEGPCSTSFVDAGVATGSFIYSAPAASTGAVGYTIYIGLTGAGSTTLQYKVPLVTQPSAVGAYPASNGVCALTKLETVTPACAVANAVYGQSGAIATVTAITVNTSPIQPTSTATSTTAVYIPNPGGRTTYTYVPGAHIGSNGVVPSALSFTIGAAAATTVPNVVGSVNLGPGVMNQVGKILRICGEATTTASTATIVDIQFQWDALGQNTAGKGVLIGDLTATPAAALATTGHATFCQDFQTTVQSASATGGSINHINGFGAVGGVTLVAPGALSDCVTPGAIGSLNLADAARINIIYLHTTNTDGAGWTLQNLSAQLI